MERSFYPEMTASSDTRQAADRQRRCALTAAWLIIGGLYVAIVACSVVLQSRTTVSVAELHRIQVAATLH